jgi:hypothetical protein
MIQNIEIMIEGLPTPLKGPENEIELRLTITGFMGTFGVFMLC